MKTLIRAGLLGLSLAACSLPAWAQAKKLEVVASFTVLADVVHQIGGDTVDDPQPGSASNGDAHVYEPTPQDAQALANADVVFVSGLGLEGWMDRLITASGYQGKTIVASDGIVTRRM